MLSLGTESSGMCQGGWQLPLLLLPWHGYDPSFRISVKRMLSSRGAQRRSLRTSQRARLPPNPLPSPLTVKFPAQETKVDRSINGHNLCIPTVTFLLFGISLLPIRVSNFNATVTNSWQMMKFFKAQLKQTLLLVNYF